VELAVAVLELPPELMERLTLVVARVATLEITVIQAAQAVAVSSSFVIQTHLEPQQAQQVHQRLLWLEALGSTNSQPMVLLRSSHVGLG